jgi:predicted helicase
VQRQKEAPIYVVIGNPPYNAGQVNENDNNKNRKYPVMDKRVQDTYIKDSKATSVYSLQDPYVKAFRMASDKIIKNGEGILCFVTNNGFLDGIAFDGMRKHLRNDFDHIALIDLGGNVRKNPKLSGTTHNVFGIQVGVSVSIMLLHSDKKESIVEYARMDEYWNKREKYAELNQVHNYLNVHFQTVNENAKHLWLTDGMADDWDDMIPLGSKEAKSGKGNAIFSVYSRGLETARDAWVYNYSTLRIEKNLNTLLDTYNSDLAKWINLRSKSINMMNFITTDDHKISWSSRLIDHFKNSEYLHFDPKNIRISIYRPFNKSYVYTDTYLTHRRGQFPRIFPLPDTENVVICLSAIGQSKPFHTMAVNVIPDLHLTGDSQCFPLYIYDEEGNNKKDNITDWGLEQFRKHYQDSTIEKLDVYHYVYGILHDPAYREKYAANLKRELPRIPFRTDFWAYAEAGKKLMDIHIKYEDQDKYPVTEEWSLPKNYVHPHGIAVNTIEQVPLQELYYVSKMKRDKNDPTKLIYNDFLTISGIPSEVDEYKLGNRSALNWIIDQYQVSKDKRSGITNNPNDWSYESGNPRYILDLIQRIITVSMQTNAIVQSLPRE